jgi:WNK lysine deficient protein kinase
VKDTALASKRGLEKAIEWLAKLKEQDIMTVGDLRDLQDDDWQSLYLLLIDCRGLTVFASRALKNALYGKPARSIAPSPKLLPSSNSSGPS